MARFIIVRHGHTKGTEANKYYGRTDLPLSLRGISQIKKINKNIGGLPIDYIYTSPLKRCTQTANILKGKKSTAIEISDDLTEIDFGDWEGLTLLQMGKKNPEKFNKWLYDFANFHMPGGESVKNMIRRVMKFWKYILNKHKDGNILIVTHGGPAKVIIMNALGISIKNFWHLEISAGSVSLIETFPSPYPSPPGHPCKSMGRGEGRVRGMVKGINIWAKLF